MVGDTFEISGWDFSPSTDDAEKRVVGHLGCRLGVLVHHRQQGDDRGRLGRYQFLGSGNTLGPVRTTQGLDSCVIDGDRLDGGRDRRQQGERRQEYYH